MINRIVKATGLIQLIFTSVIACGWGSMTAPDIPPERISGEKPWDFMVYMVNNNNLHRYGLQNFRQMIKVGSNDTANVLLQMDEFGEPDVIRFFIEHDNAQVVQPVGQVTTYSGTPENLIDFMRWGITDYKSQKKALVLWNHGAGIKDPHIWGRMIVKWRDEFWMFNRKTGLFELERKYRSQQDLRQKLESLEAEEKQGKQMLHERGIAFNDTTQTYLSNEDLKSALDGVCSKFLGKKLDILIMDACHMAMIEVASQVKSAANVLVASQEVEPGSGYNYKAILEPFKQKNFDPVALAKHIVACYDLEYRNTMGDYTQSAIDLMRIDALEENINVVAKLLLALFDHDEKRTLKTLRALRTDTAQVTEFLDTDYIDLYHFYQSLAGVSNACMNNSDKCGPAFGGNQSARTLWAELTNELVVGMKLLDQVIIANATGDNLTNAHGLSIYFPTGSMHASYYKTEFAKQTLWPKFLERYLTTKKGED